MVSGSRKTTQNVSDLRPLVGVDLQQTAQHGFHFFRIQAAGVVVLPLHDLEREQLQGFCLERGFELHDFVEDDAERPDVCLESVGIVVDDFGGDVVGGADDGPEETEATWRCLWCC